MRYHLSPVPVVILCIVEGPAQATAKGLSQIVTPDLQPEGNLSLSLQLRINASPTLTRRRLSSVSRIGRRSPSFRDSTNEEIFGTEIGLLRKEPYLLSIGFVNWSPRSHVDPQPYIEGGYYTEHRARIVGAIHADYKMRRFSVTPTTLISNGVSRSISRAVVKTRPRLASPGISLRTLGESRAIRDE